MNLANQYIIIVTENDKRKDKIPKARRLFPPEIIWQLTRISPRRLMIGINIQRGMGIGPLYLLKSEVRVPADFGVCDSDASFKDLSSVVWYYSFSISQVVQLDRVRSCLPQRLTQLIACYILYRSYRLILYRYLYHRKR